MGACISSGVVSQKCAPLLDLAFADARSVGRRFFYMQREHGWSMDLKLFVRLCELSDEQGEELFALFDATHRGRIDAREVVAVHLLGAAGSLREKVLGVFEYFAPNDRQMNVRDLALTLTLCVRAMDAACEMAPSTISALVVRAVAASILRRFDASGRRKLTASQFLDFVMASPSAVSLACRRGTTDAAAHVARMIPTAAHECLHVAWEAEFRTQIALVNKANGVAVRTSLVASPKAVAAGKAASAVPVVAADEAQKRKGKVTQADVLKVRAIFEKIDVDHSGSISIKELSTTFDGQLAGGGSAAAMFQLLDVDGSGTLEFDEILRGIYPFASETEFAQYLNWAYPQEVDADAIATLARVFGACDERLLNLVVFRDFLIAAEAEYALPMHAHVDKQFIRTALRDNVTKRPKVELDAELSFRSSMAELFASHLGLVAVRKMYAKLPQFPPMTGAQHNLLDDVFTRHLRLEHGADYDEDADMAGHLELSRAGLDLALQEMELEEADREFLFRVFDTDGSETISRFEFKSAYRRIWIAASSLAAAAASMDDKD